MCVYPLIANSKGFFLACINPISGGSVHRSCPNPQANVPAEIGMGDLGRSLQSRKSQAPVPFLKIRFHETWTQAACSCAVDTWWWCNCFTARIFSCSVPDQCHVMQGSSQCSSFDNMRGGVNSCTVHVWTCCVVHVQQSMPRPCYSSRNDYFPMYYHDVEKRVRSSNACLLPSRLIPLSVCA